MITLANKDCKENEAWDLRGMSTDDKRAFVEGIIPPIPNGSTFIEIDTHKVYIYDSETESWI